MERKTAMTALITGASSGIGRDMARVLARRGISLILVARRTERLEALKAELSVPVDCIGCDLSRAENCVSLHRQLRDRDIDILINNAGFGLCGAVSETALDQELRLIDTNIRALHILTKLFLQDFRRKKKGFLLNVASSAAFLPGPKMAAYYASKNYVLRLTEAIYEELRREHSPVSISVLCPGPVRTEFSQVADVQFSLGSLSSQAVAEYAVDGMFRRRLVLIPGGTMKLLRFLGRFAGEKALLRIVWHMQRHNSKDSQP